MKEVCYGEWNGRTENDGKNSGPLTVLPVDQTNCDWLQCRSLVPNCMFDRSIILQLTLHNFHNLRWVHYHIILKIIVLYWISLILWFWMLITGQYLSLLKLSSLCSHWKWTLFKIKWGLDVVYCHQEHPCHPHSNVCPHQPSVLLPLSYLCQMHA